MSNISGATPSARTYLIGNDSLDWVCGVDRRGRQVFLYHAHEDHLTAAFFDVAGDLLEVAERKLPPYAPTVGPGRREAEARNVEEHLTLWQAELGLRICPLRVRSTKFADVVIEQYPGHLSDFLADPQREAPDETTRSELRDMVADWDRRGCYVLWLGKDYWMSGDGQVDST